MQWLIYLVLAWNLFVFLLYGWDKKISKGKGWRVPERTLISCAFLLGGVGAVLGMTLLRHKTKHMKFKVLVPLSLAANAATLYGLYWVYFR